MAIPGPTSGLADSYGRVATDLRVSLTDRCNLRCSYCMPAEGLDWLPTEEMLTDDEVVRLVTHRRRAARHPRGPLHRRRAAAAPRAGRHRGPHQGAAPDAPRSRSPPTRWVCPVRRTTLAAAGLDRVNVSLDTIRPRAVPRRSPGATAWTTCSPAWLPRSRPGSTPVKVNAVLLRGINDHAGARAAALVPRARTTSCGSSSRCRSTPSTAGRARGWSPPTRSSRSLETEFELTPDPEHRGSAPAETFLVDGGPATVGVIASVTRPFCGDCDRVRLTADGQVRNCLFAREESDLRRALRGDADRRGDRRPVAPRDDDQAPRPRHRRRDLPPARPARCPPSAASRLR